MATPLSIYNLLEGGWRTVLSIAGISIAVVLIFMQLGFLGAVLDTAVIFYNNLKFDLVACSPDYYHFCDANQIPREYLEKIENVPGVEHVQPYHISLGKWNYAAESVQRGMLIMGVAPTGQTFARNDPNLSYPDLSQLAGTDRILVDQKSRPTFLGANNKKGFSEKDVGLRVELNQKEVEIAGLFKIGTGLAANGAAIIDERGFAKLFPNHSEADVTIGLIQLNSSQSANPIAARDAINQAMNLRPGSQPVQILTRREVVDREVRHWIGNTPIGFIFIAGVVIAMMVGAIVVYIVLSSDISKQIGEYATLKAMGYRNSYLSRVVLEQAIILGVTSYIVAYFSSLFLYSVIGNAANLPLTMTVSRQIIVFVATLTMCCMSGAIAMQKLRRADPADLF
ncbi:MAG: FtsX-like permease family protein [Mariniblastus sp.]